MQGPSDIVVDAFTPRFLAAYARLERIEGGYVNNPSDRGGATKYGISLRFLVSEGRLDIDEDGIADFDLDMDGDIDVADIRALGRRDAQYLYQRCFWTPLECETMPARLGEAMFDQGVNGGNGAARKLLQRALNQLRQRNAWLRVLPALIVDGAIGPATEAALALVASRNDPVWIEELLGAYRDQAADRYRAIVAADPSQRIFLNGWLRRARELGGA